MTCRVQTPQAEDGQACMPSGLAKWLY